MCASIEKLDSFDVKVGTASIAEVDSYINLLYEEMPEKVKASAMMLQLARQPENLQVLAENEIVLGALARVLREEGRKSMELSTNIIRFFCCFSVYTPFHPVIAQHKVGSLCVDIIDNELQRYDQWTEDISKKRNYIATGKVSPTANADFEKSFSKYTGLVEKQNQLLKVCLVLLLHLAEDKKVEQKMTQRGLVRLLAACVARDSAELRGVAAAFLHGLALYVENKEDMEKYNVVENLAPLIPSSNLELQDAVLRVLLNLSFSLEARNRIVKCGLLQKLVNLIPVKSHQNEVLGILYHISFDDRCKSLFTYTDCIPVLVQLLLDHPEPMLPRCYLIALAVNLALNRRNAQLMCEAGNALQRLVERACANGDPLLMKLLRNIAYASNALLLPFANAFCQAIQDGSKSEEYILECVGILGSLRCPELDYEGLLFKYELLAFVKDKLQSETCEDDMLLEVIILTATFANDEVCALTILESGIIKSVIQHLNAKQEDDEIVLHIVYLFYQLIYHRSTRDIIVKETQIPGYLLDLMHDKNPEIRKLCDTSLEIIAEMNEEWARKVQVERFRWHNCQWLEMVESQQIYEIDLDESTTPRLNTTDLLYSSGAFESLLSDESLSPDDFEDLPHASAHRPKSRYTNRVDNSS